MKQHQNIAKFLLRFKTKFEVVSTYVYAVIYTQVLSSFA